MDHRRLAVVHIIKKELGLTDAQYRDILAKVAGVRTARDLDDLGFRRLMRYLVRSRSYRVQPGGLTMRQKLFLDHLRRQCGWTPEHLQNFVRKYFHVEDVDHLTKKQAIHAIEAVKNAMQHQHHGHAHPDGPELPLPPS
jgi:hypothetical protein